MLQGRIVQWDFLQRLGSLVRIGGYDCSFQAKEGPTDFALMAYLSSGSSSSSSSNTEYDQQREALKKSNLEIIVPSPYTMNYFPSRPDLSFVGLDDYVYKTNMSETISSVPRIESTASKSSKDSLEQPKDVRPSAPTIEEWESDSNDDCVIRPSFEQNKPSYAKINFVKSNENTRKSVIEQHTYRQAANLRKSQSPRIDKRNWNGIMTQKLGNGFEFIKKACFICGSFNHLIKDCDFHDKKIVEKPMLNNKGRVTGQREIRPVYTAKVNNVTIAGPEIVVSTAERKREMTWSPQHADYQDIDGGFVAFAGSPKGGKITRKGKIRTRKLDFEDVYFVKELKFNLFSVSQMCDKKNSVLFTETEFHVISCDFKLLDESQVLLKVPRQNNMYSFDLNNVVPSGGLTCLFAKATIDESNLWHRRLGHINFKTMNKLVRGNLVRGLPLKLFENDHTCVACQKGKHHKASCKPKLVCSIREPLQMLHMDLFGPTSVRSINHKTYCLVVTDDYSRFSWVFFLATKDETSGILKTFITGIENQINHKVKIIRCDNGTEFKNNDMNQFCRMKGIMREFSVFARTPTNKMELLVLVTKPYNKTPYELLLGRPPSISFMRPFGCPVTILNTLDPLGKFDGKADEGFLGSGPEWLFDIDSLTKSMNYEPVTAGNQTNGDAGIETNVNAGQARQEKASDHEYILLPLMLSNSPLSLSSQSIDNKDADEVPGKGDDDLSERNGQEKEEGASNKEDDQHVQDFRAELDNFLVQQKEGHANNTNIVSIVNPSVSVAGQATGIFDDAYDDKEDVGEEADLNNLETTMNASPIPTTRIYKDHPIKQIIGDLH
ncbi:putative ribonuclease H-like domain-containing protein [Tanacetum coccineum]